MSNLLIRTLMIHDADAISTLMSLLDYPLTPDEATKRISILHRSNNQDSYVAVIDQDIVGLIAVSFDTMLHLDKPVARITTLIVHPKARRMKIGQTLVEKAMDFAYKNKCAGIEVTTNQKRNDALNFYQKNGFSLTSNRLFKVCN